MTYKQSTRSKVIERRTYNRPLNAEGTVFESTDAMLYRVIGHQYWLWERAAGGGFNSEAALVELDKLRKVMADKEMSVSGRTLWLGGTAVSKRREASQFSCAFNSVQTVHDCVDAFWLLLNGCGKGFKPVVGTLNGFSNYIDEIEIVPSTRLEADGREDNYERFNPRNGVWRISIGDSAEAWAKSFGKLLAGKYPAKKLVLDFSEIRPAGQRLAGYGWMCVGDVLLSTAFENIANLLNRRAGQLLSAIDIMDVINWIGTALSSRRSAEITLMDAEHPEINEFISAKKDYWVDNIQRAQSNNSIVFYKKPTKAELSKIFGKIIEAGGSEPGFINGEAALKRAPWFKGVNPCAEILLGDKNFCNLVEVDVGKFNGRFDELLKVIELAARANYRQTCVNLDDGILQRSWHEGNEFLRLCGVGVTGVVKWEYANDAEAWRVLRSFAVNAANSMADELKMPRSKAVTTVKPSGTLSKVMDTTEGVHKPLGKYIFNNVNFNVHDKIVDKLRAANYNVFASPVDKANVIVTFPVAYEDVEFDVVDGIEVNLESAVEQLERYKMLMENYVDHNCSITVSYSVDEVPEIVGWLVKNWDTYVGVSWLFRNDPTKTAEDLGYLYLPQEVVSKERYDEYVGTLLPVYLDQGGAGEIDDADCASGVCPVR
jgi:ribonucleoside-triphosphate reductase (formate)